MKKRLIVGAVALFALFLLFNGIERWGIPEQKAAGVVVGRHARVMPRKAGDVVVQGNPITTYLLKVKVLGQQAEVEVSKSLYLEVKDGQEIRLLVRKTRILGSIDALVETQ
ncbi:hypothetical protein ACFL6C_02130 [Myxococcota bacterium]